MSDLNTKEAKDKAQRGISGKTLQRIGRGQAALSREKRPIRKKLFPKGERKRKLALSKEAAENLIRGTIKRTRENQTTDSNNQAGYR